MQRKKLYKLLITFLPLIILLSISVYFSKESWQNYQKSTNIQDTLKNIELLQKYENSLLDESLCKVLLPENPEEISNICDEHIKNNSMLEQQIISANENLSHWVQEIQKIQKNSSKDTVFNIEKLLGKPELVSSVTSYVDKVEYKTNNIEEKELLHTYGLLSNILYATKLENYLVTYYVRKKLPISTPNIIFWDKIIDTSYLPNFKNIKYIPSVKEKLLNITEQKKFQTTLNNIDDMRIQILTGTMHKSKDTLDWIKTLEEKYTTITNLISVVSHELNSRMDRHSNLYLNLFLFYLLIVLLSIIALVYFYIQHKKTLRENQALVSMVNKIQALDAYNKEEANQLQENLEDAKDKEDIYTYIYNYFQVLNLKAKEAKQEAQYKSNFLSTLSHEIRTPLNGIIGFSELLKDIGVTPDQEEFLSLIEGSSRNLITIVNDVLDLSKINADKMELENISFDIISTIESTVAMFTQKAVQKDIELAVFIDPYLSHYFFGDATKLSQILTNLIGNAVKFTNPYGKINIFVQSMHHGANEAEIKFSVSDDGIGLSEEQIKNIFNPFTQANKSTSNTYGGTGLGLTISRKMVELMGGKLEVQSQADKGASFYFTLTLKKDTQKTFEPYPHFENISVGLALPVKSIKRQLDTNLSIYMQHLRAKFSLYYYEDLFESDKIIELPDIMIFDHRYARLSGELEQCASLDCKTIILTDGSLHARINPKKHRFDDVIFTPISLQKSIRILENTQKIDDDIYIQPSKSLENIESFIGIHALVADDNIINRKLIKIILEKTGLTVTLASDGKEAFEEYKKYNFDIIFMDIQMPVMDGVEATHTILRYEKENGLNHVPIIALTANVAIGDKEHYMSEGMDDYATKPLEIDVLKLLISKHCSVSLTS